jgi:hypothetical protein
MPLSTQQRQRRYVERRAEQGLARCVITVPATRVAEIKRVARLLRYFPRLQIVLSDRTPRLSFPSRSAAMTEYRYAVVIDENGRGSAPPVSRSGAALSMPSCDIATRQQPAG